MTKMDKMKKFMAVSLVVFMLAGCAASKARQIGQGAGRGGISGSGFGYWGALIGGALGAIGGAIVGHDSHASGEGAGVGAVGGALIGGFLEGLIRGEIKGKTEPITDEEIIKRLEELKAQIESMKEELTTLKEVPGQLRDLGSSMNEINKKLDDLKTAIDSLLRQVEQVGEIPTELVPIEQGVREEAGLQDIRFEFDKSFITPDARMILEKNANWLKKNPNIRIQVEGHCDERGTGEYNLALGDRRAGAAKEALIRLGVGAVQVSRMVSFGEEKPLDPGHNERAWAKNRRAHFVVVNPRREEGLPPPKFPK